MKRKEKIAQSLFEIINGLHGFRSVEHRKWEAEAKKHLKRLTLNKNVCLEENKIYITNENGMINKFVIEIK